MSADGHGQHGRGRIDPAEEAKALMSEDEAKFSEMLKTRISLRAASNAIRKAEEYLNAAMFPSKPVLIDPVEEAQDIFAEMEESFAAIEEEMKRPHTNWGNVLIAACKFTPAAHSFLKASMKIIEQKKGAQR